MPEHIIRLRGGWELHDPAGPGTRRVALPISWPSQARGAVRLVRSFQRPRIDPQNETVALRLEDVPGLTRMMLNDRDLAVPTAPGDGREVSLPSDLPARNILTLEVDLGSFGPDDRPWGAIALVIATRTRG